jgi:hypothetical protein
MKNAPETASEARGGFPEVRPVEDAPAELGQFVSAMHRLQDLTVSTRPDKALWAAAAEHVLSKDPAHPPKSTGRR